VLARDHLGLVDGESTTFPGGAAVRRGPRGAVLIEDTPSRGLGRALALGQRNGIEELHVLVEDGAGQLARQALLFSNPPTVWRVQDRDVQPVDPEPLLAPAAPSDDALAVAARDLADCDVVAEHGEVVGEVLGLEVARVIHEPGSEPRVEVGIGRHDREAFAIIHGDRPPAEALAGVVDYVRTHRRPEGPDHALRRVSPERWLRDLLVATPGAVGAAQLQRAPTTLPRPNVRDVWPAIATGSDVDGQPVVVACSVGVDLDLVPFAADARAMLVPGARLVLVVPERDALSITRSLAALLREPAEVVTVPDDWRALGSAAG
jgi:hypothetical protein